MKNGAAQDSDSKIVHPRHPAIEADAVLKGDSMRPAVDRKVVSISEASSFDGPDQDHSWESFKNER